MYFGDLTPYVYLGHEADPTLLNVGWLDPNHAWPVGDVSSAMLDELFASRLAPVRVTRGFYHCPCCQQPQPCTTARHGRLITLGSAEIRVQGKNGIHYAAPNMIYHYVEAHHYLPPQEFIDGLLQQSSLLRRMLRQCWWRWVAKYRSSARYDRDVHGSHREDLR